tara:strand:- start:51 stop:542 length:492 start_codon:yes stop_codon:yes gene_type:complete
MSSVLKVDAIQNTAGTSALTIDSNGVVTTPSTSRPAFMARRTTVSASSGIVLFDNAVLNQGSHYNTTDGKFTAPIAGLYSFSTVVLSDMGGTDNYFQLSLLINGTSYAKMQDYSYEDNDSSGSLSVVASLSASDYVQVNFNQPYYGATSAASNFTYFSGFLLG